MYKMYTNKQPHIFWLIILILYSRVFLIKAWDAEELSLFDLVEEINQNFYELFGVDQHASTTDIKRAYRKLSLQLHPDRNKEEDAEVQFRRLVAAYEVLKDDEMRAKYNEILVNGLPDWRQPVFYYRRMRKMGLIELSILLTIILTVGHFLVMWSVYYERRFVKEETFRSKKKKRQNRKSGKQSKQDDLEDEDEDLAAELDLIDRPKMTNLLPCLVVKTLVRFVVWIPTGVSDIYDHLKTKPEECDPEDDEDSAQERIRQRKAKPSNPCVYQPAVFDEKHLCETGEKKSETVPSPEFTTEVTNDSSKRREWTDADIELLVKAVSKFPGGTANRWEKIASMVGRTPREVIEMSNRMKSNPTTTATVDASKKTPHPENLQTTSETTQAYDAVNSDSGVRKRNKPQAKTADRTLMISKANSSKPDDKTSLPDANNSESQSQASQWTQGHQKLLENALIQFPKDLADRWEKISELIPGKSKEDCLQRYKYLAELVKKKRQNKVENSESKSANSLKQQSPQ